MLAKEKISKSRCIMCHGYLEKANMGTICNGCKDKFYRSFEPVSTENMGKKPL